MYFNKGHSVLRTLQVQPKSSTFSHLDKIEQTSETPRHRVQPLWPRVRPSGVYQLSQVAVSEVAAATTTWWVVLLGDVACGEMTDAKEVTGPLDVALLLGGKRGQPRCPKALLDTLPSCTHIVSINCWLVISQMNGITSRTNYLHFILPIKSFITWG